MKLIVFLAGAPCSGRTTTANALVKYFSEQGERVLCLSKPTTNVSLDKLKYETYRAIIGNETDIVIIDGAVYDTFDRAAMMTAIEEACDVSGQNFSDIRLVAIDHSRSEGWLFARNDDEGHRQYDRRSLTRLIEATQRPIQKEGFDLVFHVRRTRRLDLDEFLMVLNKYGFDYPHGEVGQFAKESDAPADEEGC